MNLQDLELNKWYKLKCGDKVMLFTKDSGVFGYPYAGKRCNGRSGVSVHEQWGDDGHTTYERVTSHDLTNIVEEMAWYVNIYRDGGTIGGYARLKHAKSVATSKCIGQIKLTITGDDFEVEKA